MHGTTACTTMHNVGSEGWRLLNELHCGLSPSLGLVPCFLLVDLTLLRQPGSTIHQTSSSSARGSWFRVSCEQNPELSAHGHATTVHDHPVTVTAYDHDAVLAAAKHEVAPYDSQSAPTGTCNPATGATATTLRTKVTCARPRELRRCRLLCGDRHEQVSPHDGMGWGWVGSLWSRH